MMGCRTGSQDRLFYSFNLDEHIPQNHLLRGIERCLDLSELRQHLADYYSHTGRPLIDPELMIRMLIVGYCYGIRSERRLCEEVHLNLAYRWFCRLGLEDAVPDHSTFSKNRHGRFRASGAFRWVFDEVVRRCMAAGLVKGEGFAVDASLIAADASHQHSVQTGEAIDWTNPALCNRAVHEYLEALDDEALADVVPRKTSLSDPQSRWTAATGGIAFFAYSTNYLIDTAHGVILDVEATPAHRTAEIELLCIENPSGETLYKIYELAEGHPSNREAFHDELGIDKEQFNRFKDAIHNPAVTGDWARHAYGQRLNSADPMTREEAEQFVRRIADRWLLSIRRSRWSGAG